MKKNFYSLKGFTVAKLLIIVVVIGILSAVMMLFSNESISSKKASDIVVNLKNLKTATLAWYADHLDWVMSDGTINNTSTATNGTRIEGLLKEGTSDTNTGHYVDILKYFNNEDSIKFSGTAADGSYILKDNGSGVWYVGYKFAANEASVKEKLLGRANSIGLKLTDSVPTTSNTTNSATAAAVWLEVQGTVVQSANTGNS